MRKAGKSCKNQSPPYCPGTGSDRCATSHPHAQNPAYQFPPDGMHPGTACNSPSPRAQSAVLSDVAHSEFMNFPPADQPPGQCTFYLQPPVGLAQPGQTTGMTVDQCHNLPLHLCPQPVFRCNTKYASGSAEIFTQGIYRSPSGVLTTKPHDSAGAHRRACARIADSVCVINRDLLRKFINGKETAKIRPPCRASHTRACTCCICPYGYRWWVYRTHPPQPRPCNHTHQSGRSTYRYSPA